MTTAEERQQIGGITGLKKPSSAFRRQPTQIPIPRNDPPGHHFRSQADGQNPFSKAFKRGPKPSASEDVGNVTSSRTLTRGIGIHDQGPPAKRRKTLDYASSSGQGSSRRPNSRPSRPPLAPEPISSDDDDIDESYVDEARLPKRRSSPDPLNSLPHDLGPSDQTSKYDSTRIRGSDMLNPIIVPDGDDTAWAHNRYHTNDDPIEGSSDSAFPSLPYRNTHERDNDITQPLKIDLASKQKKPSGVAKNMKGKKPVQSTRTPLAFESVRTRGSSTSSTSTSQRQEIFPVKEAYVDAQLFQARPGKNLEMFWNRDALRMTAGDEQVVDINLAPEHCKGFTDSYTKGVPPVIQLKDKNGTMVTIRLDRNYDPKKYSKQRSILRLNAEMVKADGKDTLWEYAIAVAQGEDSNAVEEHTDEKRDQEDTLGKQSDKVARLNALRLGTDNPPYLESKLKRNAALPSNSTGRRSSKASSPNQVEVSETRSKSRRDARLEPRRSTRNVPLKEQPDELILVYPPGPGAVNINKSDLSRLDPGEYLNDTLIEFGLKLWLYGLEKKNAELARQIHIFNSFFYKKLNQGKDVQQTFESIRKWTSKIDIFEKKYIIVPINEHLHWYLAIICEPEHVLSPKAPNPSAPRKQTRSTVQPSVKANNPAASDDNDDQNITSSEAEVERNLNNEFQSSCIIDSEDIANPDMPMQIKDHEDDAMSSTSMSYGTHKEEIDETSNLSNDSRAVSEQKESRSLERSPSASASRMIVDSIGEIDGPSNQDAIRTERFYQPRPKSRKGKERAPTGPDILMLDDTVDDTVHDEALQETYIFIMDSLGSRHPQAINRLSNYLKLEAKDKKGVSEAGTAKGKFAAVPVQPNFCDCGVYLLHFAQTFMSDPIKYSEGILAQRNKPIPNQDRQKIWNDSRVAGMRGTLAATICHLADEWKRTKTNEKQDDDKKQDDDDDLQIIDQDIEQATKKGIKSTKNTKKNSKPTISETEIQLVVPQTPANRIR